MRLLLLTTAIVLATIGFGVGSVLEKATPSATPSAPTHESAGEPAASGETSGEPAPASGETVLGFNPESVPLIVTAIVGSLVLAVGIWLCWRLRAVLWLTAAAMTAFCALDVVEVMHQVALQHPTLVAVAAPVAVLHGLAALTSVNLALRSARLESAVA